MTIPFPARHFFRKDCHTFLIQEFYLYDKFIAAASPSARLHFHFVIQKKGKVVMITLYSGTPGAGKSLHLASRLCNWMQFRNAPIIGNFSCDFSSLKKQRGHYLYIDNSDLTPERLATFALNYRQYVKEEYNRNVKEGEILLVIDECQLLFNSRDWGQKNRMNWCAFFTQHRKLHNLISSGAPIHILSIP